MRQLGIVVLAIAAGVGVVCASEPGEPLDASDWVVVLPGLYAESFLPYISNEDCASQEPPDIRCIGAGGAGVGTDGSVYFVRPLNLGPGSCYYDKWRYEIWRTTLSGSSELVAYLEDRCGPGMTDPHDGLARKPGVSVDRNHGFLHVGMPNACLSYDCEARDYLRGYTMIRIRGLETQFDVLQTFTPEMGFRVPYMPEGFQSADYFDTYYGTLASVGDWSQAQPLQCAYPASPPSVGDYLTVADTLPTPDPGQGYYYVTAATYQGETRYGRQASGGVLSGRDPAVLPGCVE